MPRRSACAVGPRRTRAGFPIGLRVGLFAGLLLGLSFLVVAAPAWAHPAIDPSVAAVGQTTTFTISVDAPSPAPLLGVDVTVPDDFVLLSVADTPGWTMTRDGDEVRFVGRAEAGREAAFLITGTPGRRGVLVVPVTTRSADGEVTAWTASCLDREAPFKGALVFVGVDPATACEPAVGSGSALKRLGLGTAAAGLVLAAAYPALRALGRRRDVVANG